MEWGSLSETTGVVEVRPWALWNNPWSVAEPLLSPVQQIQQRSPLDDGKNNDGYSVLEASLKGGRKKSRKWEMPRFWGRVTAQGRIGGGDGGLSGGGRLA